MRDNPTSWIAGLISFRNLRGVLFVLVKASIHVNANKNQCAQKEVKFLGYDILARYFNLDTYVQEQWENFPKVSSRIQIRRVLGYSMFVGVLVQIQLCGLSHCEIY